MLGPIQFTPGDTGYIEKLNALGVQINNVMITAEPAAAQALASAIAAAQAAGQVASALQKDDTATVAALFALDLASGAIKQIDTLRHYHVQSGIVTITQAESTELIRTYATAAVVLARPFRDANYAVHFDVLSAAPSMAFVGEVGATNRATNGFTIELRGSATNVQVRWTVTYLDAIN